MSPEPLPTLPCLCASLRRAARAVTRVYDEELRREGLRVAQFTLLQVLSLKPGMRQGEVGEFLAVDTTTLTRTLGGLTARGWIRATQGDDRREVRWNITAAGERKLRSVRPAWERAQTRLRSSLTASQFDAMLGGLGQVAGTAKVA